MILPPLGVVGVRLYLVLTRPEIVVILPPFRAVGIWLHLVFAQPESVVTLSPFNLCKFLYKSSVQCLTSSLSDQAARGQPPPDLVASWPACHRRRRPVVSSPLSSPTLWLAHRSRCSPLFGPPLTLQSCRRPVVAVRPPPLLRMKECGMKTIEVVGNIW